MKSLILTALLIFTMLLGGCSSGQSFDSRLNPVVSPYRFSIASWEGRTLSHQVGQWFSDLYVVQWLSRRTAKQAPKVDDVKVVTDYFATVSQINILQSEIAAANTTGQAGKLNQLQNELDSLQKNQAAQAGTVEKIIEGQVRATLAEQGIFNPTGKGRIGFPPLLFKLEELPSILVISPRDKIEEMRSVVLQQNLTLSQKESIEASADNLGVSSLVVALGGLATYPSLIDSGSDLQSTLDTAAHEWLHQYLAFTPLGVRYVLNEAGITRNYDITTMNESLAGMFGKEVGALVYQKYYSGYDGGISQTPQATGGFDFNAAMRNIRKTVDVYLAHGQIDQAETYMEQQWQVLVSKGYYIRKLNQAYFAFYGTYADNPAFVNPIGADLATLRNKSHSLKDFLRTVDVMTSPQDLTASLK